jgi:hypothetical protein
MVNVYISPTIFETPHKSLLSDTTQMVLTTTKNRNYFQTIPQLVFNVKTIECINMYPTRGNIKIIHEKISKSLTSFEFSMQIKTRLLIPIYYMLEMIQCHVTYYLWLWYLNTMNYRSHPQQL